MLTDSGGFQMIRRDFLKGVSEEGISFNSPFDGTLHKFTPEKNMEVQLELGADILMAQDDCAPAGASIDDVRGSLKRTLLWAERCKKYFDNNSDKDKHGLFGIVQGGIDLDLRERCIVKMNEMDFDGYALGGLSIGEAKSDMYRVLEFSTPKLPSLKPRYLMGVGSPEDIIRSISLGIDAFDSVFPTRNARHSTIYTRNGRINLSRSAYRTDLAPLDEDCSCYTCRQHTRSYVAHLLRQKELLGLRLTTIHNLHFLIDLIEQCKNAIKEGIFNTFSTDFLKTYIK